MKYNNLLEYDMTGFDKSRYIKQLRAVISWKNAGARNTIEASMGIGKTICGIIAIKKLLKRDCNRTVIVIVPSDALKIQWEKELVKFNVKNTKVYVINTALRLDLKCNLLILDELHLYATNNRLKVFNTNAWILGLTGTFERLDGRHDFISRYAPICYTISHEEAVKNNYVLDVDVYNVPIPLSIKDKNLIKQYSYQFQNNFKFFKSFDDMMKCTNAVYAKKYALENNTDVDYKTVQITAVNANRAMQKRKALLYNSNSKIEAVKEILRLTNKRTLTFGLSTDTCDLLTKEFPKSAISYHSNIERSTIKIEKSKLFKTKKGVENAQKKKPRSKIESTDEGYLLKWKVDKKLSKVETLENIIHKFKSNKAYLNKINTALALKQGFSVDELELVIVYARTSSFSDFQQIRDRACRIYEGKKPIMINLYHPNTQEVKWLKTAQKKEKNVKEITFNKLLEIIK